MEGMYSRRRCVCRCSFDWQLEGCPIGCHCIAVQTISRFLKTYLKKIKMFKNFKIIKSLFLFLQCKTITSLNLLCFCF